MVIRQLSLPRAAFQASISTSFFLSFRLKARPPHPSGIRSLRPSATLRSRFSTSSPFCFQRGNGLQSKPEFDGEEGPNGGSEIEAGAKITVEAGRQESIHDPSRDFTPGTSQHPVSVTAESPPKSNEQRSTYRKFKPPDEGMDAVKVLSEAISTPFLGKPSPVLVMEDLVPPPLTEDKFLEREARKARQEEERLRKKSETSPNDVLLRQRKEKPTFSPAEMSSSISAEKAEGIMGVEYTEVLEHINQLRPKVPLDSSQFSPGSQPLLVLTRGEVTDLISSLCDGFRSDYLDKYIDKFGSASGYSFSKPFFSTELEYGILRRTPWHCIYTVPIAKTKKPMWAEHIVRFIWNIQIEDEVNGAGRMDVQVSDWQLQLLMNQESNQNESILERIGRQRQAKIEVWKSSEEGVKHPTIRFTTDSVNAEHAYDDLEKYLLSIQQMELLFPPRGKADQSSDTASFIHRAAKAIRDYVEFDRLLRTTNVIAPAAFSLSSAEYRRLIKQTTSIKVMGTQANLDALVRGLLCLFEYPALRLSFPPHAGHWDLSTRTVPIAEGGKTVNTYLLPPQYHPEQFPPAIRSLSHQYRRECTEVTDKYPLGLTTRQFVRGAKAATVHIETEEKRYRPDTSGHIHQHFESYATVGHLLTRAQKGLKLENAGTDSGLQTSSRELSLSENCDVWSKTTVAKLLSGKATAGSRPNDPHSAPSTAFVHRHPGFLRVARRLDVPADLEVRSTRVVKAVFEPSPFDYQSLLPKRASFTSPKSGTAAGEKVEKMQDAIYTVLSQPRLEIVFELPTEVPIELTGRRLRQRNTARPGGATLGGIAGAEAEPTVKILSASLVKGDLRTNLKIPALAHDVQIVRRLHHPLALDPTDPSRSSALIDHLAFLHSPLPSVTDFLSSPGSTIPSRLTLLSSTSEFEIDPAEQGDAGIEQDSEYRLVDCSLVETLHFPKTRTRMGSPPDRGHMSVSFVRTTPLLRPVFGVQGNPKRPFFGNRLTAAAASASSGVLHGNGPSKSPVSSSSQGCPVSPYSPFSSTALMRPQWVEAADAVEPIEEIRINQNIFLPEASMPLSPTPTDLSPSSSSAEPESESPVSRVSSTDLSDPDLDSLAPEVGDVLDDLQEEEEEVQTGSEAQAETQSKPKSELDCERNEKHRAIFSFICQAINFVTEVDQAAYTASPLARPRPPSGRS